MRMWVQTANDFFWIRCLLAGRSVGLSAGSLVAGIMLGAALNAWLRVDIVPIGVSVLAPWLGYALLPQPSIMPLLAPRRARHSEAQALAGSLMYEHQEKPAICPVLLQSFGSPGVFVSTFGITALGLASAFLR